MVDGWIVGYEQGILSPNPDLSGTRGVAGGAFRGCRELVSVRIPSTWANIGDGAFSNCKNLTSVTIPDNVTYIGTSAFAGCATALYDKTTFPGLVLVDGWIVGYGSGLSSKPDLDGTRGVAGGAFYDYSDLVSLRIPSTWPSIGEMAFAGCKKLTSVTIPGNVKQIGYGAFAQCLGLKSVTFQDGVESIGQVAFGFCTNITTVSIPDSMALILDSAFSSSRLAEVSLPPWDQTWLLRLSSGLPHCLPSARDAPGHKPK